MKTRTMKIGIAVMALAVAVTLVGASVLTSYGEQKVTATVKQSIVFDGKEDNSAVEHSFEIFGGCIKCIKEIIKNRACMKGVVDFQTTYSPGLTDNEITTTIYQVPQFTTLILEDKDPTTWQPISNGIQATLTFETMKTTFDYEFNATGLQVNTGYVLIYYADFEDRYNNWGGNNPGALIGTFTTGESGNIPATSGSINLAMNLPSEPDANIAIHNYSGGDDNYEHAHGAKIWLVPLTDYNVGEKRVINWNPNNFLFETDLIGYSDCNIECPCWLAPMVGEPITGDLTIPAKTDIKLVFCYEFAINIVPYTYTISTNAVPVVS